MIFIYSYSQCRIMLATKLPRPRQWRFITFANLMFILILPLLSLSRQLPYSSWKNHKTDITGDTQTGSCRRQFILFWIGIGVFTFVEKGKQQEEKKEEKKNQPQWLSLRMCIQLSCFCPFLRFLASIIWLGAQSILGWWSVIAAPLFRIWGFPGFSPEKMAHCVAFECSNQAKTKQTPKLRLFCFQKDNSLRRAWIHAVGKTSPPKIPVCVRIIAEAIATINHA